MLTEFNDLKSIVKEHLSEFEFIKVSFVVDDNLYIIEPNYTETENPLEIFNKDIDYRGIIIDEHGKLLVSFSHKEGYTRLSYRIYELEKSKTKIFETQDTSNTVYIIEDYKLKKVIARLISIVESYGIKPKKYERGSTELEHLLWMLYEIYTQKKPISKRYNWLGFVQGILVSKNIIDIQHERDIMCHIF